MLHLKKYENNSQKFIRELINPLSNKTIGTNENVISINNGWQCFLQIMRQNIFRYFYIDTLPWTYDSKWLGSDWANIHFFNDIQQNGDDETALLAEPNRKRNTTLFRKLMSFQFPSRYSRFVSTRKFWLKILHLIPMSLNKHIWPMWYLFSMCFADNYVAFEQVPSENNWTPETLS